MDETDAYATHAGHEWFSNVQAGGDCDRGIDGVAASLQGLQACDRGMLRC